MRQLKIETIVVAGLSVTLAGSSTAHLEGMTYFPSETTSRPAL